MTHLLQRCSRVLETLLFLAVALPSGVAAGEAAAPARERASEPAWQWKAAERLSHRFNPDSLRKRADEALAEERAISKAFPASTEDVWKVGAGGSADPITDRIDGRKTPELFLPSELFDSLMNLGFPQDAHDQMKTRDIVAKRAAALGFGRDMWRRLERTSAQYLSLRHKIAQSADTMQPVGVETLAMDNDELRWCRARSSAIAAAKSDFGEEAFLRLLYLAVAPHISRTYLVKDGYAAHARFLLFVEGGCR